MARIPLSLFVVVAVMASCAREVPANFPAGDQWTFALVDPLEEGALITPVYVDSHGPYLFVLDPEARQSVVASELIRVDPRLLRAEGRSREPISLLSLTRAQLKNVRVGDLSLNVLNVRIAKPHSFDAPGRRIAGVIGADVLVGTLPFGFDRDRGIAWLSTRHRLHPQHAHIIDLDEPITIGQLALHVTVDLGGVASHVAGLTSDRRITFGGISRAGLALAPPADADDCRLGLEFFRTFTLAIDRSSHRLYLSARSGDAGIRTQRLERWGALLPACAHRGCVRLELVGHSLTVQSEATTTPLQVVVRATTPSGESLPELEVVLPQGARSAATELSPRYIDAVLEVIDISPFPRECPNGDACIVMGDP